MNALSWTMIIVLLVGLLGLVWASLAARRPQGHGCEKAVCSAAPAAYDR